MNPAPLLQIIWLWRRAFLAIFGLTFVALFVAIQSVPKQLVSVRAEVNVGSAFKDSKRVPLVPADHEASRALNLYVPSAIEELQGRGIPSSALGALQASTFNSIGSSIVLSTTIETSAERIAKDFQRLVTNQIIKEAAPIAQAALEDIQWERAAARRTAEDISKRMDHDQKQVELVSRRIEDLWKQVESYRTEMTKTYQLAAGKQADELAVVETKVRELREQTSALSTLLTGAMLERSRFEARMATTRREQQQIEKVVAEADRRELLFNKPSATDPVGLARDATPRLLTLAMLALIISFLFALASIVLLHNSLTNKEHPRALFGGLT